MVGSNFRAQSNALVSQIVYLKSNYAIFNYDWEKARCALLYDWKEALCTLDGVP